MPVLMHGEERLETVTIREKLPQSYLKAKQDRGETYVCVKKEAIVEVALLLRDEPELDYKFFCECVGVDYSKWLHNRDFSERFEVVYNLYSLKNNSRIFLKIGVDDNETVPTLMHVYSGAEFPEREIWDMFGIIFAGNEQKQRFLLPDDWIGHPLRKEYPLGGEDVLFDKTYGPAVEDISRPHAGESFDGKTGTTEISGR